MQLWLKFYPKAQLDIEKANSTHRISVQSESLKKQWRNFKCIKFFSFVCGAGWNWFSATWNDKLHFNAIVQ
jgi:hypothetical protein